MKVISGGQTGVDQAALRAALHCGLQTGGWSPPGQTNESGVIPSEFPLIETPLDRSPAAPDVPRSQRTEWNVRDSDVTLVFQRAESPHDAGSDWTIKCATKYGRPLLVCDPAEPDVLAKINVWLSEITPRVLNIAGPSESSAPGIERQTYELLVRLFARYSQHNP
jgi:hypothetical protein